MPQRLASQQIVRPTKTACVGTNVLAPAEFFYFGMGVNKGPGDEPPTPTCVQPGKNDYALIILIIILSTIDEPLRFGDAIGLGLGAGALVK